VVSNEALASAVVAGLATGSIYALIAFGYGLVYSTTNVFNFAQGDLVTLGAVVAYVLYVSLGVPAAVALLAVFLVIGLVGAGEERLFIGPVRAVGNWGWMISTLAFGTILRNLVQLTWGSTPRFFPSPFGFSNVTILGLHVASAHIAAIVAALSVAIAFELLYARTLFGKAMLAVAEDRVAASLRGINVRNIGILSFAMAAAVSGLAGFVIAPSLSVSAELGVDLSLKAFVALAIGGFTSFRGALAGGLIFGLMEAISGLYVDSVYVNLLGLGLLVFIFSVRPQGMFSSGRIRTV
jgi:branched-chain amino acid transport system permease protein